MNAPVIDTMVPIIFAWLVELLHSSLSILSQPFEIMQNILIAVKTQSHSSQALLQLQYHLVL